MQVYREYKFRLNFFVLVGIILRLLGAAPVLAQDIPAPPQYNLSDPNAINLANRGSEWLDLDIQVGNETSGLNFRTFMSGNYPASNFDASLWFSYRTYSTGGTYHVNSGPIVAQARLGSGIYLFLIGGGSGPEDSNSANSVSMNAGPYNEYNHNGEVLSCTGNYLQFYTDGICTLTLTDGTLVEFAPICHGLTGQFAGNVICDVPAESITKPDGEIIKFSIVGSAQNNYYTSKNNYFSSISSSLGWMIRYNRISDNDVSRYALNLSIDYCSITDQTCLSNPNFPLVRRTYENNTTTIWRNSVKIVSYQKIDRELPLFDAYNVISPTGVNRYYDVQEHTNAVTIGGSTWNYDFTLISPDAHVSIASRTNPDGSIDKYTFGSGGLMTETDGLGRTTAYEYTGEQNLGGTSRLYKVTTPEGSFTRYTYDENGNLVEIRAVAKPGTGLADSVTTMHYIPGCTYPKTCHKPDYTIDPRGNRTDYTYDPQHGGVLTQTGPVDAAGVRPQTRYYYTKLYPKIKNASGALIDSTYVWRLTSTSTCRTATAANPASCVIVNGSDQETITEYEYNTNNLLLTKVTVRAGNADVDDPYSSTNLWQSTSYVYDDIGNQVVVDGPRTDVDDKTYTTFDVLRRKVFEIGADPDGSSSLKRAVVRHLYDIDGREYRTEQGTCGTVTFSGAIPTGCSDFTLTSYTQTTYSTTTGLPIKTIVATVP